MTPTPGPVSHAELTLAVQRMLDDAAEACGERFCRIAVATNTESGPTVRYLLLKGFGAEGFEFYTNYRSRKAAEMEAVPQAGLAMHWWETGCQLRAEGKVSRLTDAESDHYFASRDRQSQLGAWASQQSHVATSPLADRVAEVAQQYPGDVPRPPHWGGYRLTPRRIELWFDRPARLHDRFEYVRQGDNWQCIQLDP